MIIACIGVKPNINKGGWQEWEGLISNFQINRYKENIQYEENVTLSEYKLLIVGSSQIGFITMMTLTIKQQLNCLGLGDCYPT